MKRLKGPELNVPPALADVYYDLRDRHLLPLLALVIVAIAAVPFLLGGDTEQVLPRPVVAAGMTAGAGGRDSARLTVVEAKPGLRDYHKRLARRKPKNPFRQKFTGPVLKGAKLNTQTGSTTNTTTTTISTETHSGGAPSSSPSTGGSGKPHLVFFAWAINAKITKSGGQSASEGKKQEPTVKKKVLPQTPLPGEKTPVVTYMGPGRKGDKTTGKALLLVSNDVKSVFGETRCVSGGDVCQLIEVEPGFPVTFIYGANEVHYTINVLKLELVITGHS
jgi:hypothetical protein